MSDDRIKILSWASGNNPISLHLEEEFVTPEWLINTANLEIEHGEVKRTIKVTTLQEAVEVIKESGIVYFPE